MARQLSMLRHTLAGLACLGATLAAPSAGAENALKDLLQKGKGSPEAAQQDLRSRGYALVARDAAGERSWQYWWSARDNACVVLATTGKRVDKSGSALETDCNQGGADPARLSANGRIAAAAATSLGVRELMHKSHQRDLTRHNDVKSVADFEQGYRDAIGKQRSRDDGRNLAYADGYRVGQAKGRTPAVVAAPAATATVGGPDFERGYRDGLNKRDLGDRDRGNKVYIDGYKAGQAKGLSLATSPGGRDYERGYRDAFNKERSRDSGNSAYANGYRVGQAERDTVLKAGTRPILPPVAAALPPPTRPSDLVGRRSAELESGMKALGFTRLGGFKKGRESFSTWSGNGGCARAVERDGKVTEVGDMGDRAESSVCR